MELNKKEYKLKQELSYDNLMLANKFNLENEAPWYESLNLSSQFSFQKSYITDCDGVSFLENPHYEVYGEFEDKIFKMSIGKENQGVSESWCFGGIVANLFICDYWITVKTENMDKNELLDFLVDLIFLKKE